MSARRFDREPGRNEPFRHFPDDDRDDYHRRPPLPRAYQRRSPSPRPLNAPPTYEHQPKSDVTELKIKGASAARDKEFNGFKHDSRDENDFRRGRSRSPPAQPRRPYRDRDREEYRSRSPRERDAYKPPQWARDQDRLEARGQPRSSDTGRERSPLRGREMRQDWSREQPRERSWDSRRDSDYGRDYERPYDRHFDRDWRRSSDQSHERLPRSPPEPSRRPREDSEHRDRSRSRARRRDESPYYGGPPSRDVILEGLPASWVEEDITTELTKYHGVERIDTVRVIRDKITKQSRRFGFVTFPSIEPAKIFLASSFPALSIQSPSKNDSDAETSRIRVAFSIARDDREGQQKPKSGDWVCQSCSFLNFKGRSSCRQCHAQIDASGSADLAPGASQMNIGDSDVSPDGTPSQFLIIRNLEPSVNEDLFARGVSKLLKPSSTSENLSAANTSKKARNKVRSTTGDANLGAREGSFRRILLVRDRATNDSWRYGFAEFSTIEDAQAALIRYSSFERFTIASKPVTVDYIHAGVFVPVLNGQSDFYFNPLGNPTTQLTYWDENAYCNEVVVSEDAADDSNHADMTADVGGSAPDRDGKPKKRKGDGTESATKQKKSTPAHLQYWSARHAELHGKKLNAEDKNLSEAEVSKNDSAGEDERKSSVPTFVDLNSACCWLCMRQFEDRTEAARHERGDRNHHDNLKNEVAVAKAREMIAKSFASVEETSKHENLSKTHRENLSKKEVVREGLDVLQLEQIAMRVVPDVYVDNVGKCCYLCCTEFEDELHTRRHRWASAKHRANLKDEEAVRQADQLVGGLHRIKPEVFPDNFIDKRSKSCLLCWKQFGTDEGLTQHEGKSLHRKNLANEDNVFSANVRLGRATGLEADVAQNTSAEYRDRAAERRKAFGTSEKISLAFGKKSNKPDAQPTPKDDPVSNAPSKGAALLGKMGWQAGEGLGAQSTGRTAPIATDMYAQGVGLGAEGGKIGDAVEEAGRQTGGDYKEFVSRTRDKAKERYQNME